MSWISKLGQSVMSQVNRAASDVAQVEKKAVGDAGKVAGDVGKAVGQAARNLGWLAVNTAAKVDPSLTPYPTTPAQRAEALKTIDGRLSKRLGALDPAQAQVLADVRGLGVSDVDIFHGSHVVIADQGKLYDQWRSMGGARPRTSSHYPTVKTQQYEIDFKGIGPLLFGKDPQGNTWFQMEGHPFGAGLVNDALHGMDYLIHRASGDMNVGPMGLSPHSEKTGQALHVAP